jgi:hypothetical protein
VQAARAGAFPWSRLGGSSLNLFVWFVVGAYLIWGCCSRFRLLGLAVMPLAAALFPRRPLGGGTRGGSGSTYGNVFLVLHVGLVLAAFAGLRSRQRSPRSTSGGVVAARAHPTS